MEVGVVPTMAQRSSSKVNKHPFNIAAYDLKICIPNRNSLRVVNSNSRVFALFVLRFYGPVNSYGHVEPVSYPLTLFLGRLRPTKRLTST